jgi:hypothetical protein
MVPNIEPMISPVDITGQLVPKVLLPGLLPQLNACATDYIAVVPHGVWLDMEEISEKIPMGFDSKKRFAEMSKDGKMNNGVRRQMMNF